MKACLPPRKTKKRQPFVTFDLSEITDLAGDDAGDPDIRVDGAVKDAFGNVEIGVIVDRNGDGFVSQADLATGVAVFPKVTAKGGRGELASATIESRIVPNVGAPGVRTEVIFYSPGKGSRANTIAEAEAVWSW